MQACTEAVSHQQDHADIGESMNKMSVSKIHYQTQLLVEEGRKANLKNLHTAHCSTRRIPVNCMAAGLHWEQPCSDVPS